MALAGYDSRSQVIVSFYEGTVGIAVSVQVAAGQRQRFLNLVRPAATLASKPQSQAHVRVARWLALLPGFEFRVT